mmetsp:Transcript_36308/g.108537  ORF Transcript_36308/g.108537 Transcript_36308/m.108537 type:complete len:432 (+) Transcript_36308:709-2004(+)
MPLRLLALAVHRRHGLQRIALGDDREARRIGRIVVGAVGLHVEVPENQHGTVRGRLLGLGGDEARLHEGVAKPFRVRGEHGQVDASEVVCRAQEEPVHVPLHLRHGKPAGAERLPEACRCHACTARPARGAEVRVGAPARSHPVDVVSAAGLQAHAFPLRKCHVVGLLPAKDVYDALAVPLPHGVVAALHVEGHGGPKVGVHRLGGNSRLRPPVHYGRDERHDGHSQDRHGQSRGGDSPPLPHVGPTLQRHRRQKTQHRRHRDDPDPDALPAAQVQRLGGHHRQVQLNVDEDEEPSEREEPPYHPGGCEEGGLGEERHPEHRHGGRQDGATCNGVPAAAVHGAVASGVASSERRPQDEAEGTGGRRPRWPLLQDKRNGHAEEEEAGHDDACWERRVASVLRQHAWVGHECHVECQGTRQHWGHSQAGATVA